MLKQQLTAPLQKLFADLTGVELGVIWHSPLPHHAGDQEPPLCPSARRTVNSMGMPPRACQACLRQNWTPSDLATDSETRFTGACGSTNLVVRFHHNGTCLLTLVVQARLAPGGGGGGQAAREEPSPSEGRAPRGPDRERPLSAARASCNSALRSRLTAGAQSSEEHAAADACLRPLPRLTPQQFNRAEALLRLILDDLEATLRAHERDTEHAATALGLRRLETENTRLRNELHRRFPDIPAQAAHPAAADHAHQIVAAMIDYVHEHYRHPMSLGELAVHLKMTPNYLSALFSKTIGVTFHHYLAELRLAKAEELLSDPSATVCEVACAVGYASPRHFTSAFRARTGLCPTVWRVKGLNSS